MTIRINLLPHRQIARAERKRQLGLMVAATVALAIFLVFMGHQFINTQLSAQQNRNQRLQDAITQLDKEIEEIKHLKDEIKTMLDRKKVVEDLQAGRSQTVILLDEITRQLPESVYLKTIKQAGNTITLQGYADSNNRVAILVRNLTGSKWLEFPELVETKSEIVNAQKLSNFTLTVKQKNIGSEVNTGAVKTGKQPDLKGSKENRWGLTECELFLYFMANGQTYPDGSAPKSGDELKRMMQDPPNCGATAVGGKK